MHANTVGLVHRATAVGVVDIVAAHGIDAEYAGVIAEDFAHDAGLVAQKIHLSVSVGNIQMPSRLRLAFGKLGHQVLEGVEAFTDFRVQLQGHVLAPALYPLRAIEAAAGILALAAVAAGAAQALWLASRTTARMPCSRARNRAVERPVKPEPTMTTSASMSPQTGPSSSGGRPAVPTQ